MRINWTEELSSEVSKSIYIQLVEGKMGRRQVESAFKNTPYAGSFRSLVEKGGLQHAKTVARKALRRRNLVSP